MSENSNEAPTDNGNVAPDDEGLDTRNLPNSAGDPTTDSAPDADPVAAQGQRVEEVSEERVEKTVTEPAESDGNDNNES